MACKYRIILSIDGDGIKGIIPLKILDYLHQHIHSIDDSLDVTSWVDVFSSTSASSIFTGALMLKNEDGRTVHTPKQILDFYKLRGTQIFSQNVGVDSENSIYPLSFTLEHFFGKVNMMDFKNHFLFLSYNLTQQVLFPFSNAMDRYHNLSLATVMNACSAIQHVYPTVKLGNIELCDAMFKIQNPALLVYNYARLLYPQERIVLLSIGSGDYPENTYSQANKTHQDLLTIKEYDNKLIYFRYQPELYHKFDSLVTNQVQINHLLEISDDFIHQNKANFDELLDLMALKAV